MVARSKPIVRKRTVVGRIGLEKLLPANSRKVNRPHSHQEIEETAAVPVNARCPAYGFEPCRADHPRYQRGEPALFASLPEPVGHVKNVADALNLTPSGVNSPRLP
jgi:hypothetical protein